MTSWRCLRLIGAVALALATLSGCSVVGCSPRELGPPSINLDARQWLAAHPGATLAGCLDNGPCVSLATNLQIPAKEPVGAASSYVLRLTGEMDGSIIFTQTRRITIPVDTQITTQCGTNRTQRLNMSLDAAGQLHSD